MQDAIRMNVLDLDLDCLSYGLAHELRLLIARDRAKPKPKKLKRSRRKR